jgi:hypothetical protein
MAPSTSATGTANSTPPTTSAGGAANSDATGQGTNTQGNNGH